MTLETLDEAREWLRERVDDGERCPCCTQFAKVYRRRIHAGIARALIGIYREAEGEGWVYIPAFTRRYAAEFAIVRHWGLAEEAEGEREDGSSRNGWWRLTPTGVDFVLGRATVPKYARIYDSRCLGLVGDPVTIRDALGKKFNYDELMAGV